MKTPLTFLHLFPTQPPPPLILPDPHRIVDPLHTRRHQRDLRPRTVTQTSHPQRPDRPGQHREEAADARAVGVGSGPDPEPPLRVQSGKMGFGGKNVDDGKRKGNFLELGVEIKRF